MRIESYKVTSTELPWEIVDNFSYTLKRFGILNRTERHSWACYLHILLECGPEELAKIRAEDEQEDLNGWP